jgi:phosphatidylserine synthase
MPAMLNDFYSAFAPLSFTVYGLWLIVVQTRHAEWRHSAEHRRRAYAVSLHFAIPGLMSLLALVDPTNSTVWRVSFALSAAGGAIILGYLQFSPIPTPRGRLWRVESTATIVLYVLIVLVAISPAMAWHIGAPIRVEAVLLSLIVFLGVNVAWALMFDEVDDTRHVTAPGGEHA